MLNKTITIDSVEIKQAKTGNWKYIIKDKEGDKYYFYKDTKNGESEAFVSFNSLSPKNGDNLTIGYNEEDKTFVNDKGQTINYKDRFIATILRVSNPASQPETRITTHSGESREAYGLRLAIHGMVNGLLAGGATPAMVSEMLPELFGLEEDIELRLSRPAGMNAAELKIKKANDSIENIEVNVDDIPFK